MKRVKTQYHNERTSQDILKEIRKSCNPVGYKLEIRKSCNPIGYKSAQPLPIGRASFFIPLKTAESGLY